MEVMELGGGFDKSDGDEMNKFNRSSLRRDVAGALRLQEVVAIAGSLPLDGCVSVASLDFLNGLSSFLSGEELLSGPTAVELEQTYVTPLAWPQYTFFHRCMELQERHPRCLCSSQRQSWESTPSR